MNEIVISLISCTFSCVVTIACFYIKNKYSLKKDDKVLLDFLSQEKIKEIKIYIDRDDEIKSNQSFGEYNAKASFQKNNGINVDLVVLKDKKITKEEVDQIQKKFKSEIKIKYE